MGRHHREINLRHIRSRYETVLAWGVIIGSTALSDRFLIACLLCIAHIVMASCFPAGHPEDPQLHAAGGDCVQWGV